MSLTRRNLLLGAGALLAWPARGLSFGAASRVDVAELDLGAGSLSRPDAWKRLLYDLVQSTSVEAEPRSVWIKPDDVALFAHPFCVLLVDGGFAIPGDEAIEQLSQFLAYGGFLVIDDTTGGESKAADGAVRALVERLFPTRPLAPLPGDHPVHRAFFLLEGAPGRVDHAAWLEGVTVGNQCPLIYCRNDPSGALDRDESGTYRYPCVPGGEAQRREAVKLGINLMMYALTSDYKNDQSHIRQLMLERRLK